MRLLFITSIPSPYRVDFFNALGKLCPLEVLFESHSDPECHFNLYPDEALRFPHRFLSLCSSHRTFLPRGVWAGLTARCDRLIIHTWHTRTETTLLILLRLLRRPYWIETDGNLLNPAEGRLKRLFKRFLLGGAEGYFSPNAGTDQYLQHYGAQPERIHRYSFTSISDADVLPRLTTMEKRRQLRERLQIPVDAPVIISVGQFIHRKGFDILLNAMAGLSVTDAHLYIIGGKPTDEYLRQRERLHLTERVHFVGYCSKSELADYYQSADLFVLPTREDIWGLVINEAMAYGLPVITTDHCQAGLTMLDSQEHTIVPTEDAESLRASIGTLLTDATLRQTLSQRNLDYTRQHTIEAMAREHAQQLR